MYKASLFAKRIERVSFECQKHGEVMGYINALNGDNVCPKCIDDQLAQERLKQFEDLLEHRLRISNIPQRYINTVFERKTGNQKEAVRIARRWANDVQKNVWSHLHIKGPTGTGKTLLSCRLSIYLIQKGWNVKYTTSSKICDDVKSSYKKDCGEDIVYNLINHCDLLVLDEIDTVVFTDHDRSLIHKIIRGRYDQMMPIITVSNSDTKTLIKTLGERAVSALAENQTIIDITGDDKRLLNEVSLSPLPPVTTTPYHSSAMLHTWLNG